MQGKLVNFRGLIFIGQERDPRITHHWCDSRISILDSVSWCTGNRTGRVKSNFVNWTCHLASRFTESCQLPTSNSPDMYYITIYEN